MIVTEGYFLDCEVLLAEEVNFLGFSPSSIAFNFTSSAKLTISCLAEHEEAASASNDQSGVASTTSDLSYLLVEIDLSWLAQVMAIGMSKLPINA